MASRIAIVGVGEVGAATAFALILSSVCGEILIVEKNPDKRDAQVRDLSNAACRGNSRTRVRTASYKEAAQSDIIIITAGSKRVAGHRSFVGETSLQVLYENVGTMRSTIHAMKPFNPNAILLIVSNPVDILTTLAQEISGLPRNQVIGSGTFVDSVRLRGLLAEKLGIAASSIDAYVLGEHGDTQFVAWSLASVGGVPLDKALPEDAFNRKELADLCKYEGQHIVQQKGAIAYGIGSVVSSICASIIFDERNIRPVSYYQPTLGCCLSLPVVLGRNGIAKTIVLPLNDEETEQYRRSALVVKEAVNRIEELRPMYGS